MVFEAQVDNDLLAVLRARSKPREAYNILSQDQEVTALLDQANTVSISRMGYNDHGRVHAKIVALNSMKIHDLLVNHDPAPNIIREGIGDEEDAIMAVLTGAYLHDIGMSVSRDSHDFLGVILAKNIVARTLSRIVPEEQKRARLESIILEEILCHLGKYRATSFEARIVATSDGTDMTKGRARIPYKTTRPDIHQFSALAVENVEISSGERKPIRITVTMNDTAGVFQIEHQLVQKITDVGFEDHVEIVGNLRDGRQVTYLA